MTRYQTRPLTSDDFSALVELEQDIFGGSGEELLCSYYIRLCCDFFADTCFITLVDGRPVGYLLGFVNRREAYCTTLAVRPEFQRTRVVTLLLRQFVRVIMSRVDSCWFTVKPDNVAARKLHKMLGATDVEVRKDFYGPGDERIVSRIDRAAFQVLRQKYERLGLVEPQPAAAEEAA
ncbi:MAG: GNAT family N-acetyltransferase [Proteobacteria bacterium]|nr:GNAT family N-acetyltransferase [Pseudomonadota bacterium]